MKKITFFIDKTRIVDYLVSPIRYNIGLLKKRGYNIRFTYKLNENLPKSDVIVFVSKSVFKQLSDFVKPVISEPNPVIDLLKNARKYADKIVWLDSSDSTTVTHFELLPYVDLYLKKHVLKDKNLYKKDFYGGRIFSDYYHKEFGINDDEPFKQFYPLKEEYFDKVQVAWNIGLGDTYNAFSKWNSVRRMFPGILPVSYKYDYENPTSKRTNDLFLKTSKDLSRNSVTFHRRELIKRLDDIISKSDIKGVILGRLPRIPLKEYRAIIRNSKITFGPFGWGELNVREYEALISGCLLLRPDISHMDTWPDIFHDKKTCVFYKWDFSNLEELVLKYLKDDKARIEIAKNGQNEYKKLFKQSGREAFCDWFIQQIEK